MFGWFTSKDKADSAPSRTEPRCTYCGGTEFYEGPSGGMSTNVLCANEKCRHWFNFTPALGLFEDLNKVEPSQAEKEERRRKAEEARAKLPEEIDGNLYCTKAEAKFAAKFWYDRGQHLTFDWFLAQLTRHRLRRDLHACTQHGHYGGPARYAWYAKQEEVPKAPGVYGGAQNNDMIVGIRVLSVLIGQITRPPDWFDPEAHLDAWEKSKTS